MDGPSDFHIKWSKADTDKYIISLTYGILKTDISELIYKTETDSQT